MLYFSIIAVLLSFSLFYSRGVEGHTARNEFNFESATSDPSYDTCPPWFIYNETTSKCQCGNDLGGIVKCNDKEDALENAIMNCYCMTHDETLGTISGSCSFNCLNIGNDSVIHHVSEIYYQLPLNSSQLNDVMCRHTWNREGHLCGKCKDGFQLSAYSYQLKCTKCSSSTSHWIVYLSVAFLPLTVFFIFVLVFRISATSPKLMAYVLLAQYLSSPICTRMLLSAFDDKPRLLYSSRIVLAMYGIWNLDFFRTLMPPICLNISTLQVLALDYAIAVYPLGLVVLTYMLIQLHARGCLPLVILWLPFRKCHIQLQSRVDAKTTIIDVFASFLVLSYMKLLSVSSDLLIPTQIYNVRGERVGFYLYFDASYEYFGREHLPYGILALLVSFFFLLLPLLLLLLYPLKIFQRFFGHWQTLRIFMDSFQGSFKDGVTEGRYDYRYFSAVYLTARILFIVAYSLTLSGYFLAISIIIFMSIILFIVVVKPYRSKLSVYGKIDVTFISLLAMWSAAVVGIMIASTKAPKILLFSIAFTGFLGILPLAYIPLLLLKLAWSNKYFRRMLHSFRQLFLSRRMCLFSSEYLSLIKDRDHQDEDNMTISHSREEVVGYGSMKDFA